MKRSAAPLLRLTKSFQLPSNFEVVSTVCFDATTIVQNAENLDAEDRDEILASDDNRLSRFSLRDNKLGT
jgi:hypothetical protein